TANRAFIIVCGVFLSAGEVGAVALVLRLAMLMQFFQTASNMAAPVEYARLYYEGDRRGLNSLFQSVAVLLLAISMMIVMPPLLDAERILGLFGRGYADLYWIVWPLLGKAVLNIATGPVG